MKADRLSPVIPALLVPVVMILFVPACRQQEPAPNSATPIAAAATSEPTDLPDTPTMAPTIRPTETLTAVPTEPPPDTPTPRPSATPRPPTATPEDTPTPEDTATPENTPTAEPTHTPTTRPTTAATRPPATAAPPTLSPNPTLGDNLLPNPSFEEGHYLQNNVAELQVPNGWRVDYQEGPTGYGGQTWDVYVRPETRVLSQAFLPESEHSLYIFNGSQTVKIFKDAGAISVRLMTDIDLQPGTYVLEGNFYSDVFESYSNGQKYGPSDPNAGETMLFAGGTGTGWVANSYLARNQLKHTFTINTAQRMTVGMGFRGRYAIQNNGWFVDDLSLRRLQ